MTLWSRHYEKQGGKWKCIHQNIFHSRTKSDHHSLLVANHLKNSSQAAVPTEYFSISKYWCVVLVGCVSVPSREKCGDPGESMLECVRAWNAIGGAPVPPHTMAATARQRLWKENLRGWGKKEIGKSGRGKERERARTVQQQRRGREQQNLRKEREENRTYRWERNHRKRVWEVWWGAIIKEANNKWTFSGLSSCDIVLIT